MSSNATDTNLEGNDSNSHSTHAIALQRDAKPRSPLMRSRHLSLNPFTAGPPNATLARIAASISPELLQQLLNQAISEGRMPTSVVVCHHSQKKEEEAQEDVSEEFVKNYNEHFGNEENHAKARRLLAKMRVLAGLDPGSKPVSLNIPSARMGLAILAGLKSHEFRMKALEGLLTLLENDEITKDTSIDLVSLTMKLMKQMDRELIQTEILDVQIEIAKAYGAAAELLQHHYAKKHINAITKELKAQLANTARTLEDLNRQHDPKLTYPVSFALEGVKRLKDDRKELFEIFERICHAVLSAASMFQYDMSAGIDELHLAIDDLNINIKSAWYDGVMLVHQLAKKAKTDPSAMTALLVLISDTYKKMNWRFLYDALQVLTNIALASDVPAVRKIALEGTKTGNRKLPGLLDFKDFEEYSIKPDLSPIVHLSKPTFKDRNLFIRKICIEGLQKLTSLGQEKEVKTKAKIALIHRSLMEHDPGLKQLISDSVPDSPQKQKDWLCETEVKEQAGEALEAYSLSANLQKQDRPAFPNPLIAEIGAKNLSSSEPSKQVAVNPAAEHPKAVNIHQKLSRREAKLLANAMATNPELKLNLLHPHDYYLLARYLRRKGLLEHSIQAYTSGIEHLPAPDNGKKIEYLLYFKRGLTYRLKNDFIKSQEDFKKAFEKNPSSSSAALELSRLYMKQNDLQNAEFWAEKAYQIKGNDPEIFKQINFFKKNSGKNSA